MPEEHKCNAQMYSLIMKTVLIMKIKKTMLSKKKKLTFAINLKRNPIYLPEFALFSTQSVCHTTEVPVDGAYDTKLYFCKLCSLQRQMTSSPLSTSWVEGYGNEGEWLDLLAPPITFREGEQDVTLHPLALQ